GGFFGDTTGNWSATPSARARHEPASGQASQRGDRGTHTVAPSSISASFHAPASRSGTSLSASARTFAAPAALRTSSRTPKSRATTRVTLPSTAAARRPKARLATAAAVYGP